MISTPILAKQSSWADRIERALMWVACGYAISLSWGITLAYIFLVAGIVLSIVHHVVAAKSHAALSIEGTGDQSKPAKASIHASGRSEKAAFQWGLGPLAAPLIAYAIATAVSGWFAPAHLDVSGALTATLPDKPYGFRDFLASLSSLRPFVVYFWAFDLFARMKKFRPPVIACLLTASACGGMVATVEHLCNWHPWGTQYLQGTGFLREPMAFSGVMQIFSLLAVATFLVSGYETLPKPLNLRIVFAIVAIANVLGLIFAFERSAWLGFASGVLAGAALLSWQLVFGALGLMTVATAIGWFFVHSVQQRLMGLLQGQQDPGTVVRLQVWQIATQLFKQSMVTGVGASRFPHIFAPGATQLGKEYLAHAHSNGLHTLAAAGLLGFCTYIWIVLRSLSVAYTHFLRYGLRPAGERGAAASKSDENSGEDNAKESQPDKHTNNTKHTQHKQQSNNQERALALGLIMSLVSLTIAGLFEYNFGTGQVRLSLWFLLGMIGFDTKFGAPNGGTTSTRSSHTTQIALCVHMCWVCLVFGSLFFTVLSCLDSYVSSLSSKLALALMFPYFTTCPLLYD